MAIQKPEWLDRALELKPETRGRLIKMCLNRIAAAARLAKELNSNYKIYREKLEAWGRWVTK